MADKHIDTSRLHGASESSAYPNRVGNLFIHTQSQQPIHVGGLPSPAPSGPAPSPPAWPQQTVTSANGPWSPASPISPLLGEEMDGGFNKQLEALVCAAAPTPSPSMDAGFQDWTNAHCHSIPNNTYLSVPRAHPAANRVLPGYTPPWAGHVPLATQPDEQFFAANTPIDAPCAIATLTTIPNFHPETRHPTAAAPAVSTQSPSRRIPPNPTAGSGVPASSQTTTSTPTSTLGKAKARPASGGPTLRTAARRFKRPSPPPKPGESPEHQRARTNHNMVEQQYRHRLHARFEALLDALPKGILDNDDEDEDDDGGGLDNAASGGGGGGGGAINGGRKGGGHGGKKPRRMSKVDVLNRAARVIRFLESDNERTRREVEMLRRERDAAFGRVAVRGGTGLNNAYRWA
ncbi:uncharacterized protein THITE_2147459 [Thermothielavioides terrestris NRRL 8126]|uniref:BHLH domain-containing protein n=2 Tax=Thermothielavioides terrestris TaxID=2587410 RepID=G2RCZ1_THETT|nr:uncharacterized protein THITE_2147459 [Thermothielavioides terrestris NRRL 8126]AEO70684.1 hypothetical protein THITE_2147459 [Thermothielavioides terrestris NRRL 8126]